MIPCEEALPEVVGCEEFTEVCSDSPALLAKTITTLDHVSHGRATLGFVPTPLRHAHSRRSVLVALSMSLGSHTIGRMKHEERLAAAGIELPVGHPPVGLYIGSVLAGDLLHVGGHGPVDGDGVPVIGKVGGVIGLEVASHAARLTGLQILSTVRAELGSLNRVIRVVKVFGMVNCAPGFNNTPAVIDGCSQLMLDVFGDAGVHTRSAVGMAELPFDISVEIEAIFQVG